MTLFVFRFRQPASDSTFSTSLLALSSFPPNHQHQKKSQLYLPPLPYRQPLLLTFQPPKLPLLLVWLPPPPPLRPRPSRRWSRLSLLSSEESLLSSWTTRTGRTKEISSLPLASARQRRWPGSSSILGESDSDVAQLRSALSLSLPFAGRGSREGGRSRLRQGQGSELSVVSRAS